MVPHFGTYLTQFPCQGAFGALQASSPEVPEHPWQIPGFSQPIPPQMALQRTAHPTEIFGFFWVLSAHFSLELRLNKHVGIQRDEHSQNLKKQPQTSTENPQIFWKKTNFCCHNLLLPWWAPAHPIMDGTTSKSQRRAWLQVLVLGKIPPQNSPGAKILLETTHQFSFLDFPSKHLRDIEDQLLYPTLQHTGCPNAIFFSFFLKPSFSSQGERVVGLLWLHFNIINRRLL